MACTQTEGHMLYTVSTLFLTLLAIITVMGRLIPEHKMLCQFLGQVGLAGPAGATQDDTSMLQQQGHMALDDGFGDHRLKCQ